MEQNINVNNPYLYAIVKAMQDFLLEEMQGNLHSELRLKSKIEAARQLFVQEREDLQRQYRQQRQTSVR